VQIVVELTSNAQARLQDRGIAEADVRAALASPDALRPSVESRWHARKRLNERTLEVLFLREAMRQQVISAYWAEP
jgi:hypothetical protein